MQEVVTDPQIEEVQSSVFESELEYNPNGNVRASTYKRTAENVRYKSEEGRGRTSSTFFTSDYLDNRYMNDRVEMELTEFK